MTLLQAVSKVLVTFGVPDYFIGPYLVSIICLLSSLILVIAFLVKENIYRVKSNNDICVAENVEKLGLVPESRESKRYGQNLTSETFTPAIQTRNRATRESVLRRGETLTKTLHQEFDISEETLNL